MTARSRNIYPIIYVNSDKLEYAIEEIIGLE